MRDALPNKQPQRLKMFSIFDCRRRTVLVLLYENTNDFDNRLGTLSIGYSVQWVGPARRGEDKSHTFGLRTHAYAYDGDAD